MISPVMPFPKRRRLANGENMSPNIEAPAPAAAAVGPPAVSTGAPAVICASDSLPLGTLSRSMRTQAVCRNVSSMQNTYVRLLVRLIPSAFCI